MIKSPIYTIGYGNRNVNDFIELLSKYEIKFLLDVRSQPFSKFNPDFNRGLLELFLAEHGVKYVFMGDSLGGRPNDKSCYNSEGKVEYDTVRKKDFFLEGIKRIKIAYNKNLNVVLMCSEIKPTDCHRSKLIGKVLLDDFIALKHIDENNNIKDQYIVMAELNKGKSDTDLFGEVITTSSRKSYL